MLTLVSVGFGRTVINKNEAFDIYKDDASDSDTVEYAKLVIRKIEAGQKSQTGNWGVRDVFETKENALAWMNYIVGRIKYEKFKEKADAAGYFYKAARFRGEPQSNPELYKFLGGFYFERAASADYMKTPEDLNLARGNAERAIDAFASARRMILGNRNRNRNEKRRLDRKIADLYRFRFDLSRNARTKSLESNIEKLISRPLPDPAAPLELVFDEP
ncbi:MAG TPA: hypothetical protein VIL74_13040 [Pyrinomonadaceae bacterium]|jgi:hypothetical protein